MMFNGGRWLRLFRESFVPVMIVLLGIFLMLLYVQFRAEYDADKVTVIDIQSAEVTSVLDDEILVAQGEQEPIVASGSDAEQQRAAALMAKKKWREAEQIYLGMLAKERSSQVLNALGVLYLKKDEIAQAIDHFNQALDADSRDTSALFNRALAYSRSGKHGEALADYRALLARQPGHFEGQYNLAILLIRQGDRVEAEKALEKAVALASGDRRANALYRLGLVRRNLKKLGEAAQAFEAAIRLRPGDPEPRVGLATLEPDTAEGHARALAQYRKILELTPDHSPALVNMALILSAEHKSREAEQALRHAIQFDPEFVRAHSVLGLLLLADERWQEARAEFEWLLQRDPRRADAYFNLGRVAYGEKNYDKAIGEYQSALKAASGNYAEAQLNLGLTYSAKKDYPAALVAYQAALKSRRQYPEAWYNTGMVHLRQKDDKRAEDAFNNALRIRPDYEQAWFNLGVVYGNTGRDNEAIDAYRKALKIRPDYHQAQLNLAVRHAKRREYDEAIRLYRAILKRDSSYSIAWLNLGNAYINNNQPGEAVAALRKAVALEPSDTKMLRLLGRALLQDGKEAEAVQILENAVAGDPGDALLRIELARALRQSGRESEAKEELAKAQQLDPSQHGFGEETQNVIEQ